MKINNWLIGIVMVAFAGYAAEDREPLPVAGNESVEEVQAAMLAANKSAQANSAARSVMLMSSGGTDTYQASGDLDTVVGSGTLSFSFRINKPYTEITSAKLHINAYDVDYPANNEHDKVYFNGEYVGRFKGANGEYRVNTFSIKPSLIKCPSSEGVTAINRFSVAVNVDNGGWVTGVGWAKLEINGETFSVNASDGTEIGGIKVKWSNMGNGTYELYRRDSKNGRFNLISKIKSTTTYVDTSVAWGRQYWYFVKFNEIESNIDVGLSGSSGVLPRVDNVEVAKLWLTGKGPYNVRVTWNNFDRDRYAVDKIFFDVEGTDLAYEWNIPSLGWPQNTIMDFDLSNGGIAIP